MQIEISHRNGRIPMALSEFIHRRMSFAFERFEHQIRFIECQLCDVNGPKGGVDQAVQLIVHMDRTSDVIIKQTSDSIYTAIANAVDRASYNIAKTLQRRLAMRVSRS